MEIACSRNGRLLLVILAVALVLRLTVVDFGLPALNDPDELMFELGALHMLRGLAFDPGWFGHPATTTMYVLALIDMGVFAFGMATGHVASAQQFTALAYADPSWIVLPGRIAMVLFAIGTIWLTWRLATRWFGERVGLIAALLLALDPVHLTWSQVIRSDMTACFFLLLCLDACCEIAEHGRWRDHLAAALWLALAIASKWPFGLGAVAILSATLLAVRSGRLTPREAAVRMAGAGLATTVFLLLASPYLLLDYQTVLRNVRGEAQVQHLGATGGGFADNLWWYLSGPILGGLGVVGLAFVVVGVVQLRRHGQAAVILAPLALSFILLLCCQRLVWERWALPLMPIGAILAAAGFAAVIKALWRLAVPRQLRGALVATLALTALVPLGLRIWSNAVMRAHDTRQLASAWARGHVPPGSTVLVEHFAFDILDAPWRILFPLGDAGCRDARGLLRGEIRYAEIERLRAGRSNVDYGTVAPGQRGSCAANFAILAQMDRYRQEQARFPNENAAYRDLLRHGRVATVLRPSPGRIGGPVVTVIDLRR